MTTNATFSFLNISSSNNVIINNVLIKSTLFQDVISLEEKTTHITQKNNICVQSANLEKPSITKEIIKLKNYKLLKKYFYIWKDKVENTNKITKNQMQQTRINDFITTLKNFQNASSTESKRCENLQSSQPIENFKNRYKVQNGIIYMQKQKLKKQDTIISELKLGIIREDILKSIETKKNIIREVFGNCSEKILCKAPLVKAVEEREKIMISARKAPKVIQKLQQRAVEREKYREEIMKRKRIKEEEQHKLFMEISNKKKFLEEEERKKILEIINEQRKQELKVQKIRQQKRQQMEQKILRAVNFYNKLLVKQCFKKLFNFYNKSKENYFLAATVFEHKEKLKIFKAWIGYVDAKFNIKNNIADVHFNYITLKRSMAKWMEFKLEGIRLLQVAEDFDDLRITSKTFVHWHRYVCKEIMIEYSKTQLARKHNNRRLLFQHFHQWIYLPAVIQLEKSKEEAKRKWREKVWKILPDFQPPEPL